MFVYTNEVCRSAASLCANLCANLCGGAGPRSSCEDNNVLCGAGRGSAGVPVSGPGV